MVALIALDYGTLVYVRDSYFGRHLLKLHLQFVLEYDINGKLFYWIQVRSHGFS